MVIGCCGWPSSSSAIHNALASFPLYKSAASSASAVAETTWCMRLPWMAPLLGCGGSCAVQDPWGGCSGNDILQQ